MATDVSFNPDPNDVIPATEEGVRNILRSAVKEPSVKRFVLTSSSAAVVIPKPNEVINVGKWDWMQEAIDMAWAPPPYTPERSFAVYAASKAAAEKALWKFVEDEKPNFVANAIVPNFNVGRIITNGGPTGGSVESLIKGTVPPFPPQYHIDVIDDARIHFAVAALDADVKNDRIFTFARPFTFTEMIKDIKELRPNLKGVAEPPKDEGEDLSKVPNEMGAQLLEKWYGQKGYKTMKQSIEEALKSLNM
jgi:nucleoside-diphosphate-sugar epimerase